MPLTLRWRGETTAPVGGEAIRPDLLNGPAAALARRPIRVGNASAELGEVFDLEGDGADGHLIVEGDARSVHGLGSGMAGGRLDVRGDAGHRLGAGMAGGSIDVEGSIGDGAGSEMAGGSIHVRGDAGSGLGAAMPGSLVGMRGGVILVDGSSGEGVGLAMRRGVVAVGGSVGAGAGRGMVAGSIVVGGVAGPGLGAGMKRGTIALLGADFTFDPGPTFEPSGALRPPVATILLRDLAARGCRVPPSAFAGPFRRYNGDRAVGGRGEIWLMGGEQARWT